MSSILCVTSCTGPYLYAQSDVRRHVETWLGGSDPRHARLLRCFDHTLVRRRSSMEPIEYLFRVRPLEESTERYKTHSIELAGRVSEAALSMAGLKPTDVDFFITTSCTGIMIPSVDAVVAEQLGMKSSLRRLPITEHGCAGGAVALGLAHDHLAAHPTQTVLVVSVEIPSLTFQAGDRSAANVISSALFADGAAAVLLRDAPAPGCPRIVRTASHRFPRSLDWMGFDLRDGGLHIVLSAQIPHRIREALGGVIDDFLAGSGLRLDDIDHFLLHPGGRRVLEAVEEALELEPERLALSRYVLREYGNLSSATVLVILEQALRHGIGRPGDHGLLVAFGPGFSAENLLLEWP